MNVRIYYHHTDCGGVVYYGRYLNFLEEARTRYLEECGVLIKELAKQDILFVVARQEIDYKSPAFYGDVLDVKAQLVKVSRVRLEFNYEILNQEGKLIVTARTVMACVDNNFKPVPLPDTVRTKIKINT